MSFSFDDFLSAGQILLLCCVVCVFLTGKAIWQNSFSKLPPGPWGMPVIGEFNIPKSKKFIWLGSLTVHLYH